MQVIYDQLVSFMIIYMLFVCVVLLPMLLILSIFTPKQLLNQYFKEPYFSLTETIMLAGFPGFLIRTYLFAWAIFVPKRVAKRGIVSIGNYMPRWYYISLIIMLSEALFILAVIGILMPILLLLPLD